MGRNMVPEADASSNPFVSNTRKPRSSSGLVIWGTVQPSGGLTGIAIEVWATGITRRLPPPAAALMLAIWGTVGASSLPRKARVRSIAPPFAPQDFRPEPLPSGLYSIFGSVPKLQTLV